MATTARQLDIRVTCSCLLYGLLILAAPFCARANDAEYEAEVNSWLDSIEPEFQRLVYEHTLIDYRHMTDLHNETLKAAKEESTARFSEFKHQIGENISQLDFSRISDPMIERKLRGSGVGSVLSAALQREREMLEAQLTNIYNTADICDYGIPAEKCNSSTRLKLSALEDIFAHNRSYEVLKYAWIEWRKQTGRRMRDQYRRIVQIDNIGAKNINLSDFGEVWRRDYEADAPDFREELEDLWRQVLPLYEQLHAYVLRRMKSFYEGFVDPNAQLIPAHLLGNMWAQNWGTIFDITMPYPGQSSVDIGPALKKQNFTVRKMFETAEKFFVSIGLPKLPETFWNLSVIEEPNDGRVVACHASAWDFLNGRDFAIKMCGKVSASDFFVIHHELGHIYYDMAYSKQSVFFRDAANPAFHEAVGDTIYLSTATPTYFKEIGLLNDFQESYEAEINSLLLVALDKLAFLPFGYLIDLWRWKLANGSIPLRKMNDGWWELRRLYQGLQPPTRRNERDFDPGAKYHIASGVPYVRYFLAHFFQHQFHESLCKAAKFQGPLHRCSILGSSEAGKKLLSMLELGSSKPWPDALEVLTDTRRPSAQALLDYFDPLYKWLAKENKRHGACFGWGARWPAHYLRNHPRCDQNETEYFHAACAASPRIQHLQCDNGTQRNLSTAWTLSMFIVWTIFFTVI